MKICSKCKIEKPFAEFYKDKRAKDASEAGNMAHQIIVCAGCHARKDC